MTAPRIYVAAPYAARDELRRIVVNFNQDFEIVSSWLNHTHPIHEGTLDTAPDMTEEYVQTATAQDLAEVDSADYLIMFSSSYCQFTLHLPLEETISGGRHIETGYALAKGKPVVVVGTAENVFHRALCTVVRDYRSAIRHINSKEFSNANHA
jgi:nucleoside 2-deoxyribosyltransferase